MKTTIHTPARVTVPELIQRKNSSKKIVALTAYDYTMARIVDSTGVVDVILVGDSLGTVVQGLETTLPVTLEEMIYHCRAVVRAVEHALVVGDMPFLSYQVSKQAATEAAGRLLKEGGVSAVKLEGGVAVAETIEYLVSMDIPVMGHIGLTPQSVHRMGGYKVQGAVGAKQARDKKISEAGTRERVVQDALAVEKAGAFALVIEGVPSELAREITERVQIPCIGIGAGAGCDGQILVTHDLLGLSVGKKPRFVKEFAKLSDSIAAAIGRYAAEVQGGQFPSAEHTYTAPKAQRPEKISLCK